MSGGGGDRAAGRALVVGVGNPHRGDDGAGPVVAGLAAADPRLAGADVRCAVQLTPELAAEVAEASVVVVVDARCGAEPGTVEVSAVAAAPARGALTHHLDPARLAGLAELAYGRVPPVFEVGVAAARFEAGTALSDQVRAALPAAVESVIALATEC